MAATADRLCLSIGAATIHGLQFPKRNTVNGIAGMMGVAVDPGFDGTRRLSVYSPCKRSAPHTNGVDIGDDGPDKMTAPGHPFGGPGAQNGGRVRHNDADGFLYPTTGDRSAKGSTGYKDQWSDPACSSPG